MKFTWLLFFVLPNMFFVGKHTGKSSILKIKKRAKMLKLLPYLAVLFVHLKNSKKIRKNISCWQKFDILDIQKKEKRRQNK